jgi:oligoendopeptidase F
VNCSGLRYLPLDRKRVTEALGAIESHAELFKAYQRLRALHVAASTGIADVHSWDLSLPTPGFTVPHLTLDQSRVLVLSALAPLGADYVEHFRQLLDPANGRMDIAAAQASGPTADSQSARPACLLGYLSRITAPASSTIPG